ncbi:protein TUNICAMYCIN INDUCED 1 isoform X2 [Hevea brasiliensis]|nr:protein TUNICAMYCIN INDUCED 1 isoform X2 [Hevea brasiliensis]
MRDALVGRSVAYEFDTEIDNQVLPFKLLEDVNRWEYVDLPIFRVEEGGPVSRGDENGIVKQSVKPDNGLPVLAPFQLAGPMEIWIQDAKDMRISLPHDVDAGVLKKVVLADGAVVTVKGARSVSLRHPVDLPLPFNRSQSGFASGLLALAEQLRHASRTQGAPLLSLRIVGPTSLASPSSSSSSSSNRLRLKRLAPGLVELSSFAKSQPVDALSPLDLEEAGSVLTPKHFTTMWPLASVNGSNANLLGFEKLLASVLGPKANKKGSFRLLKADVSAQTFVKIGFGVEKKLKEGDGFDWQGFPEWRTKPESVRMHFEVLAKVDGDKIVPERVMQVNPVVVEDAVASNVLVGNVTMSRVPVVHTPSNPLTL